jgi:hypothetical protein
MGVGYLQLTGRTNSQTFGDKAGVDLVNNPDQVRQFRADLRGSFPIRSRACGLGGAFGQNPAPLRQRIAITDLRLPLSAIFPNRSPLVLFSYRAGTARHEVRYTTRSRR